MNTIKLYSRRTNTTIIIDFTGKYNIRISSKPGKIACAEEKSQSAIWQVIIDIRNYCRAYGGTVINTI